jgi:Rho GTPase-activating protein 1
MWCGAHHLFLSPKFFRKITYITSLSGLAFQVPLTQIDVPPAVYQYVVCLQFHSFFGDQRRENSKHEQRITLPVLTRSNLFGIHLEELMGFNGEKGGVPRVVKDCAQYLRQTGAPISLSPKSSSYLLCKA